MSEGRQPQHRNVCFTVNKDDRALLRLLDETHPTWQHVKYCIYQREMGSHEHFQGYMELTCGKTFAALHNLEGLEHAHFEKRRGTAKQAIHYCMKPVAGCECNICIEEVREPTYIEGPWVFGEPNAQGQRADLLEIQREIRQGASNKRIAEDHFPEWVRFGKAFKDYKRMSTVPRNFKTRVVLFIGPPGTGKSTLMKLLAAYLGSVYKATAKKGSGMYYDDYDNQDVMIIDEFNGSRMTPEAFNDLADEHEAVIPVHGNAGHQFNSKYLFIGSNYLPSQWWKNRNPAQLKQTTRRIDIVFKVGFKADFRLRTAIYDATTGTWIASSSLMAQVPVVQDEVPPPKDKEELWRDYEEIEK